MEKTIKIGNKEYLMKSSAYTQFKYKNDTGRTLIKDLTSIGKELGKSQKEEEALENFDELDDFIILSLRIAYIMCMEAKSISGSFEEFLMGIDTYLDNLEWIDEVVELAISPLSRGNVQAH